MLSLCKDIFNVSLEKKIVAVSVVITILGFWPSPHTLTNVNYSLVVVSI